MDYIAEISRMKVAGYSQVDIYIFVKDYVSAEQFIDLYEAA